MTTIQEGPDLVSIILPTFSRLGGGFLERAIDSVLAQSYHRFELIIVDDGSVDGSSELIDSYCAKDSRVKHIRLDVNVGLPAYTSSLGYLQSRGNYVAWVFDDCVLRPDHLGTLTRVLSCGDAGMVYGQCLERWKTGERTIGKAYDQEEMEAGNNHIGNVAAMVRRSVIEDVGWFDPHIILKRFCDWDLWMRIALKYKTDFIPQILAEEHGTSLMDSVGFSHTLYLDLVLKYAKIGRNQLLAPSKLGDYDPFRSDFDGILDEEEIKKVHYLIQEHFVKTLNLEETAVLAQQDVERDVSSALLLWKKIAAKNRRVGDQTILHCAHGLIRYYENRLESMRSTTQAQELYVYEQQRRIDEQQRRIDEQQRRIDEQQRRIDEQQRRIDEQQRRIDEQQRRIDEQQHYINEVAGSSLGDIAIKRLSSLLKKRG